MSLILEALRKSEAERQRGQLPSVHTAQPGYRASRDALPWKLIVGIGVVLVLIVLLWWYAGRGSPEPIANPASTDDAVIAAPANAATTAPGISAPNTIDEQSRRNPSTASDAQTAPVRRTPPGDVAVTMPRSSMDPQPALSAGTATMQRDPAPSAIPSTTPIESITQDDALPFAVLGGEQRARFPALKYSMHVYGDSAANRFAILDGARVTAGSALGPAQVVVIRRDGVVIELDGQRYLIPKP